MWGKVVEGHPPLFICPPGCTSHGPAAPHRCHGDPALRSIHLYCKPGPPGSPGPCPMLLLLLWLGAQPAAQAKYLQLYLACGFDVLAVESVLSRFLCLRRGLGQAARVLALL